MRQCAAIKPNGGRCERIVSSEQTYCYSHDPSREGERKRNAARGGKAKATGEIGQIKAELRSVIEAVREEALDKSIGAVVFQGYGVLLKAVSVGLDIQERTELIGRMEELERLLDTREERPWGA
jgi:hypothetical protein